MRSLLLGAALVTATWAEAALAMRGPPECSTILPSPSLDPARKRALTPEDLVRLRDIGPAEPQTFAAPFFTVSPDRRWAAFQLRQADPERNRYCLAMVLVDLDGGSAPRIVDIGNDPLILTYDFRGMADFASGLLRVITPRWSGDGRWIAFLKREGKTVQVWRAFADGSGSMPLTRSEVDVVDFRVGSDGQSIVFATRPDIEQQRRAYDAEGLEGWRYDERFAPWISKRPMPRTPAPRKIAVLDVASGKTRGPSPHEAALVATDQEAIALAGAEQKLDAPDLEVRETNLSGGARPGAMRARLSDGSMSICRAPACEGAMYPWWTPNKRRVRFFKRDGWADASTGIYEWDTRRGGVRRLLITNDVLSSCQPDGGFLLCLIDSSLEPRRLVRLNPATGARKTLFDPNPEFARLTLGKAKRLHWRNAFGVETVGDLVFPVGYRRGRPYPLVVVQYDTRGFLRGGTNDEYPIQAFANRGFAVLSFRRPSFPADKAGAKTFEEAGRYDLKGFQDRRSVQSSLEEGIKIAVKLGIADPKRLGITGLSDGSTTVEWALSHSSLFSAAALSSCCWDPAFTSRLGPTAAKHFRDEGYPGVLERDDPFWKDMSLNENAHRLRTPMLIHTADMEFMAALETYTGLREAGVPIDMYVYPDEYHARWQPAHRRAIYRRSLDWFDYWLRDVRSTDPKRQRELQVWDLLKGDQARQPETGLRPPALRPANLRR